MPPLISHHATETVAEIKALPFYKTFAASATAACVGEVGTGSSGVPFYFSRLSVWLPHAHTPGPDGVAALISHNTTETKPRRLFCSAQVITLPVDTCKVRLQLQGASGGPAVYK
jgi:hypothetical protein